jgi:hypothetical protein
MSLVGVLHREERLALYLDLHSHAGKKGCFFYGNSYENLEDQTQAQLFARLVSLNSPILDYDSCNFSKKHMTAKDRAEDLSKEGCGRVVVYKKTGLILSFTLELAIHSILHVNNLAPCTNMHRRIEGGVYT